MNRLIFVEGISGVGKTTTASRWRKTLRDMGKIFVCHVEGDGDNPLDPFKGAYPPDIPLPAFAESYTDCWRNFMESQFQQGPGLILDGTLLHHQINDLIRNYDASDEVILAHLAALMQIIQQANPIVFYLTSRDVAQRLRHARESRGQSIPTEEQIGFWEKRKRIDGFVLERLPVQSHILNIDKDWNLALETMTKFATA